MKLPGSEHLHHLGNKYNFRPSQASKSYLRLIALVTMSVEIQNREESSKSTLSTPPKSSPVKNLIQAPSSTNFEPMAYDEGDKQKLMDRDLDPRNKNDFIERLYKFLESRGQPIVKMPSLGYQELDLHQLYRLVVSRGGMDRVTQRQEWKAVYQELGIPTMSTSASYNTRTNYKKYLYLYELEHYDFPDQPRPRGKEAKFEIGEYIRIVSEMYAGQVFYAVILKCRFRDGNNVYYVHYNGWSNSHDEWMPEKVISKLLPEESENAEALPNPPPSRSSKSNHIISDEYFAGEKHFHPRTPKKDISSGEVTPNKNRPRLRKRSFDDIPNIKFEASDSEDEPQELYFGEGPNWKVLNRQMSQVREREVGEHRDDVHLKVREFNLHQDFRDSYIPFEINEEELLRMEASPYQPEQEYRLFTNVEIKNSDHKDYEKLKKAVHVRKAAIRELHAQIDMIDRAMAEKIAAEAYSTRTRLRASTSASSLNG